MVAVTGTYKDGQVYLDEIPPGIVEADVIVIFLPDSFWEKRSGAALPDPSASRTKEKDPEER